MGMLCQSIRTFLKSHVLLILRNLCIYNYIYELQVIHIQLQAILVCASLRFYDTKFNPHRIFLQVQAFIILNDISVRGIVGAFAHDEASLSFFLHLCQKKTAGGSV